MNERLKRLHTATARLSGNLLIPADVRAALADAVGLLGELTVRVEQLERLNEDEAKNR